MERDRGAVFLVEASLRGIVDFTRARLDDPAWWRYLRIVLHGLERDNDLSGLDVLYKTQLALLSNSRLTDESWEAAQKRTGEIRNDILNILRPWDASSSKETEEREFKSARQRYIDAFGVDPLDPAFKKWEADTIAELQKPVAGTESDEQRVSRLLRERDEEIGRKKRDG